MPDSRTVIHLCARGWAHAGWRGGFYPDDLPETWRLSYYANEFSGVLVPEDAWREAGETALAGWAEDVPELFRFYLERVSSLPDEEDARRARCLGAHFAGWVVPARESDRPRDGVEPCRLLDAPVSAKAWRLHQLAAYDLRSQRGLLETLAVEATPQAELCLFIVGDPPPMETMRTLRQLTELLGLA